MKQEQYLQLINDFRTLLMHQHQRQEQVYLTMAIAGLAGVMVGLVLFVKRFRKVSDEFERNLALSLTWSVAGLFGILLTVGIIDCVVNCWITPEISMIQDIFRSR
jgi:cytochrome b subunit of formate dehydrogenase